MASNLILGVDPSLTSSGWAIYAPDVKKCIDWGTIKTNAKEIMIFRFLFIKKIFAELIKKHNILRVGCEAPVFGGYETGTAYALYISLLEVFYQHKIDVLFIAPLQIQKILKSEGYGIAGKIFKSESARAAKEFLKDELPNRVTGDKADAFHAARIGSRFWNFFDNNLDKENLTSTEKEMFTKTHTYVRGKNKGKTERKGFIYRENDLFFQFSKTCFEE